MTGATGASAFLADVENALSWVINQHRNATTFTDDDRQLAIALGEILDPDGSRRGNGVNAIISHGFDTPGELPGRAGLAQHVQDLHMGAGQQPQQRHSIGQAVLAILPPGLRLRDQETPQLLADRHAGRNPEAGDSVGGVVGITHHKSPSFARAVTRYVAGAVLVALRQLQRMGWVRRAVAILRPSGTTEGGAE